MLMVESLGQAMEAKAAALVEAVPVVLSGLLLQQLKGMGRLRRQGESLASRLEVGVFLVLAVPLEVAAPLAVSVLKLKPLPAQQRQPQPLPFPSPTKSFWPVCLL